MSDTGITGTMSADGSIVWDDPAKAEAYFTARHASPRWKAFVARAGLAQRAKNIAELGAPVPSGPARMGQ